MKNRLVSPRYELDSQIRALNSEAERLRARERSEALEKIFALVETYSLTIDELRAIEPSVPSEMDERHLMRQIRKMPAANTAYVEPLQVQGEKRPAKEEPPRWPEMVASQRRPFNAWRRSSDIEQPHVEAWQAALRHNKFEIDEGTSEEAFRVICRAIESVEVVTNVSRFDIWCAAVNYGRILALAAKTLRSHAAAVAWLYKPCITLDRAVPIDLLWFDPKTVEDELHRLETLIRPKQAMQPSES